MEQVKAPEKIFLHPDVGGREFIRPWLKRRANQDSIEYTRTDAFIEKAQDFFRQSHHLFSLDGNDLYHFIGDFRKYMEE